MKVQQAIFASADRGRMKGYHLVAKSSGIDRAIGNEFCRWSPTQMASDDPLRWTFNCFPVSDDFIAVARTVLGGPEYSSRGGTQVVTIIAMLSNEQFAAYGHDAMVVARTALAMGWLRLPVESSGVQLELINLPDRPIVQSFDTEADELDDGLLVQIAEQLEQGRRLAIIGATFPAQTVGQLIPRLSIEARRQFSFTTGLAPAVRRPFQAHFLPSSDAALEHILNSQDIWRIEARPDSILCPAL